MVQSDETFVWPEILRAEKATPAPSERLCDPNQLFSMMQSGNQLALDRIVQCFGDQLMRVGRRYCRTLHDAEDAVQDVLVTTSEKMQSFRGEGSLEGWLVRMVINACRRMQRGRKNDPALHQEDAVLPDESQSPERATESSEIGVHLRQALSELPNTDRMILLLSEGDGWSAIEIAERLGMTHGAVRTRLTRIRQALQKKLAPLGLLPDS